MGLAPYGRPVYRDQILTHLVELKPDGSLWLDMQYLDYYAGKPVMGPALGPREHLFAKHSQGSR